ncbi:MAG TPA: phosphohistidine phosphatase SixA [Nitrospirae bacterium]|nr:phosphohistidine phosphatase SixA [Nitrospirota bacterium]
MLDWGDDVKLYLVQHAEAKTEQEDPSRGLSEKGVHDIEKTAHRAEGLLLKPSTIFHSGEKRAIQTAQILAARLRPSHGVVKTGALAPMDDPGMWADRLSSVEEDIMLVGHLPHLAKLAGLLICGDQENRAISFTMAGIACFTRNKDGSWSVEWVLTPETV